MPELSVDGRTLPVTNLGRVLWPATRFTKDDLLAYYRAVGAAMVRQLAGRPLMLGRFPEGIDRPGWGQWECRGRPEWMSVATLRMKDGREVETCVIDDVASLLWAANQGTLEFHPYLARAASFETPTAVVFDLDPGVPAGILECAAVALALRTVLDAHGLAAFPKSSGGEGLHVFVPLNTPATYEATKAFARATAARLAADAPDLVVDRMAKAARGGRVFIDWGQNDARKQTIAAYSLRTTVQPRASAPLSWEEVERAVVSRDPAVLRHGPAGVVARLESHGDLFSAVAELQQRLPETPYAA